MVVSLFILAVGLTATVIARMAYRIQMLRKAISVIAEAQATKEILPDAYPAYREQAITVFESHGLKDIVRYLPLP